MNRDRYLLLNSKKSGTLTKQEKEKGWHFCPEWDYLLTNYNDTEGEVCSCKPWEADTLGRGDSGNL